MLPYNIFTTSSNSSIAYIHNNNIDNKELSIYLSGFASNMFGTKATFISKFCENNMIDFLRFDYSGTGLSNGSFANEIISSWVLQSAELINHIISIKKYDKITVIASSMGAWIAFNILKKYPSIAPKIDKMILIAPAIDFTYDLLGFLEQDFHKNNLQNLGYTKLICDITGHETIISQKFLDDASQNLISNNYPKFDANIHILQGTNDKEIPYNRTIKLLESMAYDNVILEIIKNADHSLSRPQDLQRICDAIA